VEDACVDWAPERQIATVVEFEVMVETVPDYLRPVLQLATLAGTGQS
jgi:hypothetical protein